MQKKPNIKTKGLLFIGTIVALYLMYCLIEFPVSASIEEHHISYSQKYPQGPKLFVGGLYIIATILPSFLSDKKGMSYFGGLILFSYVVSTFFFDKYLVSVWCYFAALISFLIYLIIKWNK